MWHQYLHMWNIYHIHFVLFKYGAKNKWEITDFVDFLYSRPFLSAGDVFQEPQWMPETMDSTRPHLHCAFLYQRDGSFYGMGTLDKGRTDISGKKHNGTRFHHTIQNSTQFKTYEFLISGIFHVIFVDHSWPRVTETVKPWKKGELLHCLWLWSVSQVSYSCHSS